MTTLTAFLPVDNTGVAPSNLITQEYHQISGGSKSIIRPNFGAFFKESLILYSVSGTGTLGVLNHGTDYTFSNLDVNATAHTGKEIYDVVLILNTELTSIFSITYQALGGDNNLNLAAIYALAQQAGLGVSTPYSQLTDVPTVFPPAAHVHDISDVYGMEYVVSFLTGIKNAIVSNNTNIKYKLVTNKIAAFVTAVENYNSLFTYSVRQHIDNIAHSHTYTSASIGLENVANNSFTTFTYNGITYPAYASPSTISYQITNRPAAVTRVHASLINNPHNLNKNSIGLGNVANLNTIVTYPLNASTYNTLLSTTATQVYLGPYPIAKGVDEMAQAYAGVQFSTLIADAITAAEAKLTIAANKMTAVNTTLASINTGVNTVVTSKNNVISSTASANALNNKYNIVNYNAEYASVVSAIMLYDYNNIQNLTSISSRPVYPAPAYLKNLVCWLSANNPDNTTLQDIDGKTRLITLRDYADTTRVYAADLASTAPYLTNSADMTSNVDGISVGKIMKFTNGLNLRLRSGPGIKIKPDSTFIAITRSGPIGSILTILTNTDSNGVDAVYTNTLSKHTLRMDTHIGWIPISSPSNANLPNKTTIVVGSISGTTESNNWIASSTAINSISYPKGVAVSNTNIPTDLNSLPVLNIIGNTNFSINNQGEVGDILIYDRQLSGAEVKTVVDYLRLKYTANTALAVDYSALNAF